MPRVLYNVSIMEERFSRYGALIGEEGLEKLTKTRVAIFGIGGVGGHAAISLARAGIGHFVLVDADMVSPTNINRQEVAYESTLGQPKVEVMKRLILDINPKAEVTTLPLYFEEESMSSFDFASYDYVIDAIDTIASKLLLIKTCFELNIPIISAMGAGNKLHPERFEIADIYKTSVCPLAKIIRQNLKKMGIPHLKVVYSKEEPIKTNIDEAPSKGKKSTPGSSPFAPAVMGLLLASETCNDLLKS